MWLVEAAGTRIVMDPLLGSTFHDGVFRTHPVRDIDTDERFTLAGDITTRDCFRDRELTFQSGNVIEGLFNAAQGPDNESLRELTTVAVVVPVVAGALFFAGGHGGFH